VDSDPLKLRALVTERRLGTVAVGQNVLIQVEAFAEQFAGRVSRVSPAVDRTTRAFSIEIAAPNADHRLKPGSFATAEIEVARESALMVPESSIVVFAGVQKVMVVKDGKIKEQRVELGDGIGDKSNRFIEIRTGLTADSPRGRP
jgi:membrane fusion protein, multidrug efflux system